MKVRLSKIPGRLDKPELSHHRSGSIGRHWISPRIQTLPRLSDLTLQSPGVIPGGGGTGGGGSTVIP